MEEQISYSIVAIDETDGVTKKHCIVYGANTREEAKAKYLRGEFDCIAILDPEEEPFYDVSPSEYILSCDRLIGGQSA